MVHLGTEGGKIETDLRAVGFNRLNLEPSRRFLWTCQWTSGYYTRRVMSWPAEALLASQKVAVQHAFSKFPVQMTHMLWRHNFERSWLTPSSVSVCSTSGRWTYRGLPAAWRSSLPCAGYGWVYSDDTAWWFMCSSNRLHHGLPMCLLFFFFVLLEIHESLLSKLGYVILLSAYALCKTSLCVRYTSSRQPYGRKNPCLLNEISGIGILAHIIQDDSKLLSGFPWPIIFEPEEIK
jgi:hypothetical protein